MSSALQPSYPPSQTHAVLSAVAASPAGQLLQAPSPGAALYLPVPAQPDPHSQCNAATTTPSSGGTMACRAAVQTLLLRARRSPVSHAVQQHLSPQSCTRVGVSMRSCHNLQKHEEHKSVMQQELSAAHLRRTPYNCLNRGCSPPLRRNSRRTWRSRWCTRPGRRTGRGSNQRET
jgi:hypothetical protein